MDTIRLAMPQAFSRLFDNQYVNAYSTAVFVTGHRCVTGLRPTLGKDAGEPDVHQRE